jgi:hypothetical protein
VCLDADDPTHFRSTVRPGGDRFRRHVTYTRLEVASVVHSVIFAGLMVSAFLAGKPEPVTFVLGFAHGVLFIAMGALCVLAAVYGVLPPKVVVAVIVFGGVGPFVGSIWFVRYADQRPPVEPRPSAAAAPD